MIWHDGNAVFFSYVHSTMQSSEIQTCATMKDKMLSMPFLTDSTKLVYFFFSLSVHFPCIRIHNHNKLLKREKRVSTVFHMQEVCGECIPGTVYVLLDWTNLGCLIQYIRGE